MVTTHCSDPSHSCVLRKCRPSGRPCTCSGSIGPRSHEFSAVRSLRHQPSETRERRTTYQLNLPKLLAFANENTPGALSACGNATKGTETCPTLHWSPLSCSGFQASPNRAWKSAWEVYLRIHTFDVGCTRNFSRIYAEAHEARVDGPCWPLWAV